MINPRISIITPSFNRKKFLEETIRSVLDQGYPNLEYIVVDGGSTDGSVDIIRKYSDKLAFWCSEPDKGMYFALQKGFDRSTGEILGWLNSDDLHFPWTLRTVSSIFSQLPSVEWISSLLPSVFNSDSCVFNVGIKQGFAAKFFQKGFYTKDPKFGIWGFIQQESTFWKKSLFTRAGELRNCSYKYAGDFDLWSRFFNYTELFGVHCQLGGFRTHGNQITALNMAEYLKEVNVILEERGAMNNTKLEKCFRENNIPQMWPLRLFPSLGLMQSVNNIRWDYDQNIWKTYKKLV